MRKKADRNVFLNSNKNIPDEDHWSAMFSGYVSRDYPISVLYCEPDNMFTGRQRLHWHKEYELDYVRTGSCTYNIGGNTVTLNAGSALLISGGHPHQCISEDHATILSLMFAPDFIFGESSVSDSSMISMKYRAPLSSDRFKYLIYEENDKEIEIIDKTITTALEKKYGYELLTKGLLCELWLNAVLKNSEFIPDKNYENSLIDEQRTKSACDFITNNFTKALSLDEIAESIPVSKSECCRCFKRVTGMTPFEYLNLERVTRAAYLLQHPDIFTGNIQDLAKECGFNDASYFNKIFRKITNETPSFFKDSIRKNHRDALSPFGIPM